MASWIDPHLTVTQAQAALGRYPLPERQALARRLVTSLLALGGPSLDGRDDATLHLITAVAVVVAGIPARMVRGPVPIEVHVDAEGEQPNGQ